MTSWPIHGTITGPIVMIGFGSIGRGTLPLIERHFKYDKSRFVVVDPSDKNKFLLDERGIKLVQKSLTKDNYREILKPLLTAGSGQGFCVNVSVDTSSIEIIELCRELNVFYIDTVNEPWKGFYSNPKISAPDRTNYALREKMMVEKRKRPGSITAVSCCGANPGMVSWFVKQGLLNIATDLGLKFTEPKTREEWAALMQKAGVKGIHIAERDTQQRGKTKANPHFRQHLVDRRLHLRRLAARRTRLGHARRKCRRPAASINRLRRRDLFDAARREHARALLVPDAGRAIRLLHHA